MNEIVIQVPIGQDQMNTYPEAGEIPVPIKNLSQIPTASCKTIRLANAMDYVPLSQRDDVLKLALEKLRYGGKIIISGIDIYGISQALVSGYINNQSINSSIYGGKLSSSSMHEVISLIQKYSNLEVNNAKLENQNTCYSVVARRKPLE